MRDAAGRADRLHVEALFELLEPVPQAFSPSEDHGHDRDVHVIDEVGGEKLADGRYSSADADIQAAGGPPDNLERLGGTGVNEGERCSTLHLDRGPGMMREDEHRGMEGRVVAPPARPALVGPRAALGPELVASHDLCADAWTPFASEGVIDAGTSAPLALHLVEATGGEEPFVEPASGVSEGCFETLALAGAETVERNREVVDPNE